MKPLCALLSLILFASQGVVAQNWMARDITQRVALWVQIRDADLAQPECCFNQVTLRGGTYAMTFNPIAITGIEAVQLHQVHVDVQGAQLPGEPHVTIMSCSHDHEADIDLLVATLADSSLRILSGPTPVDRLDDCASMPLADSTIARIRLHYLSPDALRFYKSEFHGGRRNASYHLKMIQANRSWVEYRAYSCVLRRDVIIRLQGLARHKYEIRTLGKEGKVIKPFSYDGN